MAESDAEMVARVRAGDSDAFRGLVERHSRSLFRVAYRMTGNEHDAEDVVQEAFLRAYRQLDGFEARANFGTWLYRIAMNCSVDMMRSRGRHEDRRDTLDAEQVEGGHALRGNGPAPDRLLLSAELGARVTRVLDTLSPRERAAFVLRHYEGMSIEEIGRALGLRSNATKHSIFRAVRKMRAALQGFV